MGSSNKRSRYRYSHSPSPRSRNRSSRILRGRHSGHRYSRDSSSTSHSSTDHRYRKYRRRSSSSRRKQRTYNRKRSTTSSSDIDERINSSRINNIEIGGAGPEIVGGAAKSQINQINSTPQTIPISPPSDKKKSEPVHPKIDEAERKKLIEEEVQKHIDNEVQKRVNEFINSSAFKKLLEEKLEEEKKKQMARIEHQIYLEGKLLMEEMKRKKEEEARSKREVEAIMAENDLKVRQEQTRLAEELAKADEARLLELQERGQAREKEKREKALHGNHFGGPSETLTRQKVSFKMTQNNTF